MPNPKEMNVQQQTLIKRVSENYMRLTDMIRKRDPQLAAAYEDFRKKMKELQKTTDQLYKKDQEGNALPMTKEMAVALHKQYKATFSACKAAEQAGRNAGLADDSPLLRNLNMLKKALSRDELVFSCFSPGMTMPGLVEFTNTKLTIVKLPGTLTDRAQGQSSDRFAMKVRKKTKDGLKLTDGFFTKEKKLSLRDSYEELLKEYDTKDRLKAMFDELRTALAKWQGLDQRGNQYLNHLQDPYASLRTFFYAMESFGSGRRLRLKIGDMYADDENIKAVFAKYANRDEYSLIKELYRKLDLAQGINNTMENYAGIRNNRNLDRRNCAMSAVADLLDMSHIIARSEPLIVKTEKEVLRGTFMEYAEGTDLRNLTQNDPLVDVVPADANQSAPAIKSAADLQVLDFICGNIDRHRYNFTYLLDDHGRFVGIQGFDNDMCLGKVPKEYLTGEAFYSNFTSLDNMRIVTQKTAEKIGSLTEEKLSETLLSFGMNKEEIEAACDRLRMLKNSLDEQYVKEPNTFTEGKYGYKPLLTKDNGKIYVLTDPQIAELKIHRDLAATKINNKNEICSANAFARMMKGVKEAPNLANRTVAIDRSNLKEAQNKSVDQRTDIQKLSDHLAHCLDGLKEANKGLFVSSVEYDNVLKYAELVRKELQAMARAQAAGQMEPADAEQLAAQNMEKADRMFENLSAIASVYMGRKIADGSLKGNERSIKRYEQVNSLYRMTNNFMDKNNVERDRTSYRHMSFLQRTGAFRRCADSSRLADQIEKIRYAQNHGNHDITASNNALAASIDGVGSKGWKAMIEDYRKETDAVFQSLFRKDGETLRLNQLPEHHTIGGISVDDQKLKEAMKALGNTFQELGGKKHFSQADMAQVERKLQSAGEAAKEYLQNFGRLNIQMEDRFVPGLLKLNELVSLSVRAQEGDCLPSAHGRFKLAEKLAEKLVNNKLSTRLDIGEPQKVKNQLCDHETVGKVYSQIMETSAFKNMTADKSEKELKTMLQDEQKLLKSWNKAVKQKEETLVEIPVAGRGLMV